MNNAVALIPYGEIERMAQAVAKSKLFGVKSVDEAIALMLVAQAEGRHPALAARDYDIIQGRPSKKSEAMLRDFLESQGKVEWHALDDTQADATFSHPAGGAVRIKWDMKRAQAAGLGAKDMWKKYPRQMLRARTVSEGIRTVCPMATSGMYVPEEVQDFAAEKNITPTAGAADRISQEEAERLDALAAAVIVWLADENVADAVAEIENAALEADQKVYLWTKFDSKQRSAMKKESARQKAEREAKVIEQKPEVVISEAQRKRLEARISELKAGREAVKTWCKEQFGKDHFKDLNTDEYEKVEAYLDAPKHVDDFVADYAEAEKGVKL